MNTDIPILKIPIESSSIKPWIKQGDTIPKISFQFGVSDDIDLTTSTIKMQLFNKGSRVLNITNDSGITVIDDKNFEIDQIEKEDNNFPIGILNGDLEITDTNGIRFTYFNVEYTIIKQYTE